MLGADERFDRTCVEDVLDTLALTARAVDGAWFDTAFAVSFSRCCCSFNAATAAVEFSSLFARLLDALRSGHRRSWYLLVVDRVKTLLQKVHMRDFLGKPLLT